MKIIVLGAGQVGSTVAQNLASENNDVTVVDLNINTLQELQNRLDLSTVYGHAAHPAVLRQAGAEDADMIIAATNSDETNMIACQIAYTLFQTTSRIARVRSQQYLVEKDTLFKKKHIPIDVLISPERLVTDHIERIIEHPGALQVVDFADGRVRLVGVVVEEDSPMTGRRKNHIATLLPTIDACIATIYRDNMPIVPDEDTVIEKGDLIFYIAARQNTVQIMEQFHQRDKPSKHVMIAGGGNIGMALAQRLENKYRVKVIEKNPGRAEQLAATLNSAMVLNGDVADQDLLLEENVNAMGLFCALTNDDEANILSAMVARKMGARKVMSLINRPAYVDLVERGFIDVAISPHNVTIGALLRHVRRGDVVAVHSLRRGAAEALEAIAHGDVDTSEVVGRKISELPLGTGTIIGAIVRGNQVLVSHPEIVIEAEDHVIILVVDKSLIHDVENLFQVGVTY
ncbi:Trk system potassium transport protein TrkA [Chromatiales bacterium (ex Bugula neritina AB1)]|nr:Trk system potassium transport protein TrkA [Chromatiales bacterium (ex Bugula neritina AB1)]